MASTPKTLAFEETTITKDNINEFLEACSEEFTFSPDNDFNDYVTGEPAKRVLTYAQGDNLNKRLDEAFEVCHRENIDIYQIPIQHLNK